MNRLKYLFNFLQHPGYTRRELCEISISYGGLLGVIGYITFGFNITGVFSFEGAVLGALVGVLIIPLFDRCLLWIEKKRYMAFSRKNTMSVGIPPVLGTKTLYKHWQKYGVKK